MAKQILFGTPGGEWCAIDNGVSPVTVTANGSPQTSNGQTGLNFDKATLGFDTVTAPGSPAQATNPFADTGSTTLDTVNDTVYADPGVATVKGNPVLGTQPSYATVSTVLNSPLSTRLLFKNPA